MSPNDIFASQMWPWPDPALKRDAMGRILFINAAFLQLYGGSVEDWRGNVISGWPAPQPPGMPYRFETRMPSQTGEQIFDWIEYTLADGNAFALARNVTYLYEPADPDPGTHAEPAVLAGQNAATNTQAQVQAAQPAPQHHAAAVPGETPAYAVEAAPEQAPIRPAAIEPAITAPEITVPVLEVPEITVPDINVDFDQNRVSEAPAVGAQASELNMDSQTAPDSQNFGQPGAAQGIQPQNVTPQTAASPVGMTETAGHMIQEPVTDGGVSAQAETRAPDERAYERRALPIEDDNAVLGNNWRDAVIAKAVGVEAGALDNAEDVPGEVKDDQAAAVRPIRILLAEDNAINALLTRTLLEAEGHVVETAEDGVRAVEAMKSATYDLIFMDMRMPNMDGLEATRKIRAMDNVSKGLPIIALTANAFDDDRNACFDSGMNDFMTKPVSAEELSEMVRTWTKTKDERETAA